MFLRGRGLIGAVCHESKRAENRATTANEISEGNAAKDNTKGLLNRWTGLLGYQKDPSSPKNQNNKKAHPSSSKRSDIAVPTPPEAPPKKAQGARHKGGVKSLEEMASSVGPIIQGFDSILKHSYLANYDAALTTTPVVGLKDREIMYIETKPNQNHGVEDVWSSFSMLPSDAKPSETSKIFMFPYKGDFCLAIDRSVWKKSHVDAKDPALSKAVGNWPKMYNDKWEKLGDRVLPATNLLGVIPFTQLSTGLDEVDFRLVVLGVDSTISFLSGDTLGPDSRFDRMVYNATNGGPAKSPKFTHVAYWNNRIIGYDNADKSTWNLSLRFDEGTFTATDQLKIEPITELTATDVGPIGLRADGYLYKRITEAPEDLDSSETFRWARWIKSGEVSHLGVASPGVMLNLDLLTRTLKSRYIDVQTSVYPIVEKILSYGNTHSTYLRNVRANADAWNAATSNGQREMAINQGRTFISHSRVWGMIISKSISRAKESVNIMAKQLQDARSQLQIRLESLEDELTSLKNLLSDSKSALPPLKAAFWDRVSLMVLGLLFGGVGIWIREMPSMAIGGMFFVRLAAPAMIHGVKISTRAVRISMIECQIRGVSDAIGKLTTIVQKFTNLEDLFGVLAQFWGRMGNVATSLKDANDVTALLIGEGILSDISSIQSSVETNKKMIDACQKYLDVLNGQGITIIASSDTPSNALRNPRTIVA